MPYKVSTNGIKANNNRLSKGWTDLTDLQKQTLAYLSSREEEGEHDLIPTRIIAYELKLHPRAVSGIAYSLYKRGLVEKGKE